MHPLDESRNAVVRWARLRRYLRQHSTIDLRRFERVTQELGSTARRLLVTCWERLGEPGFRAVLRVGLALRREGEWIHGFCFPVDDAPLVLDLAGPGRERRTLALAPSTLRACATPLLRASRIGALVA